MRSIEEEFDDAMMQIYWSAKDKCSYTASKYFQMLHEHKGIETAKRLLAKSSLQYGFSRLWDCNCLDITVECLVLKPKYQALFEEHHLEEARWRLRQHGFDPSLCENNDNVRQVYE